MGNVPYIAWKKVSIGPWHFYLLNAYFHTRKCAFKAKILESLEPFPLNFKLLHRSDPDSGSFDIDLSARINRHKAELNFGSHRNRELQVEWNSIGESFFQFEVLDELNHKENSPASLIEELQVLAEMWTRKLEKAGDSVMSLQPAAAPKTSATEPGNT
jgi:hypothetical protein